MSNTLFITGFLRSGTTLVEKLLHNHRDVCVGSQPFPLLYYMAKEAFLARKGIKNEGYPLGHLFLEDRYTLDEFTDFLKTHVLTKDVVADAFVRMSGYSGQGTPALLNRCHEAGGGTFLEIFRKLSDIVAEIHGKAHAVYAGSKEVFCEEYVPMFLDGGARVVVVIRDPRDILASLRSSEGSRYANKGLPVLYVLRSWRKSVAFALAFMARSGFMFVRYEDVVIDTPGMLGRLAGFLGLDPYRDGQFEEGITGQDGRLWKANSSFEPYSFVSNRSVGKYVDILPPGVVRYVESVCYPELVAMGYELRECKTGFDRSAAEGIHEQQTAMHEFLAPDYSTNAENLGQEERRFALLKSNIGKDEMRAWFIFPKAYEIFRRAVNEGVAEMPLTGGEGRHAG